MSIGNKIVVILSVVVVLYAAFDNVLQRVMVRSNFDALEEQAAIADVERIARGVQEEVDGLAEQVRRWANWDDLWRYADAPDAAFEASNLGEGVLAKHDLHLLYVLDATDTVVWGRIEDPDTREAVVVREYPNEALSRTHVVFRHRIRAEQVAGIQRTERGPLLVSSAPILDSQGGGEERGTLVMGHFLDRATTGAIGARMGADFAVYDIDEQLPEVEEQRRDDLTAEAILGRSVLAPVDDDLLYAYTMLRDVHGNPKVLVRANVDRAITRSGASSVNYALLSTIGTALLIFLVLLRVLQRIVVRPLSSLAAHAVEVGRTDDMSRRLDSDREDEIGQLSGELDSMMEKLAASRAQLAKTSRLAGMSEIATGVIHNVGNVLNSVNVSANLVTRKVEALAVKDLEQMYAILEQNKDQLGTFLDEDPRGQHLLPFLDELVHALATQRDETLEEMRGLDSGLEHIMKLVGAQQAYAGSHSAQERADLAELFEEALTICQQICSYTADVEIVREFDELPSASVDRNKVMEILVNLIKNAAEAMTEAGVADKRLVLRVRAPRAGVASLEVEDNGVGIASDDLARIFHHGFTTKTDGHGFGLHAAANAATEMRGRLEARSDGPGAGATFELQLPTEDENLARAA